MQNTKKTMRAHRFFCAKNTDFFAIFCDILMFFVVIMRNFLRFSDVF